MPIDPTSFDNIIVSETMAKMIRENSEVTPESGDRGVLGLIAGVVLHVGRYLPDSWILLRKGSKLVAVINLTKKGH